MTDVAEPGTDVVPAGGPGGDVLPATDQAELTPAQHSHPDPRQYVLIALVLVILTALEVAVSYLDGYVNSVVLIIVLFAMAATKFFLVAAWYMHMKHDSPFFYRMFLIGIIGASIVYGIVMLVFSSTVLKS